MNFEEFVLKNTGRDMEYHERAGTIGLIFAKDTWNAACDVCAALAEETASGRDAEAIADAILKMRSNV